MSYVLIIETRDRGENIETDCWGDSRRAADLNSNHSQTYQPIPNVTQLLTDGRRDFQNHPDHPKYFSWKSEGKGKTKPTKRLSGVVLMLQWCSLHTAFFQLDCHCQKIHITNQTTKVYLRCDQRFSCSHI